MNVRIGQEAAVKVSMTTDGSFYWSDGQHYSPTSVSGQISGDLISCLKATYTYNTGTSFSNRNKGKRE